MLFKVGDKVKIKNVFVHDSIKVKFNGSTGTVVSVYDEKQFNYYICVFVDEVSRDAMFSPKELINLETDDTLLNWLNGF